jgi:hypothetical protein
MMEAQGRKARVSNCIYASTEEIHDAFVQPWNLKRFRKDRILALNFSQIWAPFISEAELEVTQTRIEPNLLAWGWSNGTQLTVEIQRKDATSIVAITMGGFAGGSEEQVAHALLATEKLSIMLCDLMLFIQYGQMPRLMGSKSTLIRDERIL